jgi:hypothetical protein
MKRAGLLGLVSVGLVGLLGCGDANDAAQDGGPPEAPGPRPDAAVHDAAAHEGGAPGHDASLTDGGVTTAQDGSVAVDAADAADGYVPPSTPPWPSAPPLANGIWVRVRNLCSFPIWIHAAGSPSVLAPDNAQLNTGDSRDYTAPTEWSASRVTAYVDGPGQGELEKAEMTFSGGTLNYNVTYVDWVGLPLEIIGYGGNCTAAQDTTGCYAKQSQILSGCPEPFLLQGKKCMAARSYCLAPANQGAAYCHALDSAIASCSDCPGGATPDVYACSGPYAQNPRMCAALNRGMTSDPDNSNAALYYQKPPFNTYSKWVHEVCPNIYGFPYDDWQSHGGFRSCNGTELRITFCPSG